MKKNKNEIIEILRDFFSEVSNAYFVFNSDGSVTVEQTKQENVWFDCDCDAGDCTCQFTKDNPSACDGVGTRCAVDVTTVYTVVTKEDLKKIIADTE